LHEENQKKIQWAKELRSKCSRLYSKREYEKARECYLLKLALNPNDPRVHMDLAFIANRTGDPVEYYHRYQKVLELDPNGGWAEWAEKRLSEYDEYMMMEEQSYPPAPIDPKKRISRIIQAAHLYSCAMLSMGNNPGKALHCIKQALALVPEVHNLRTQLEALKNEIESK